MIIKINTKNLVLLRRIENARNLPSSILFLQGTCFLVLYAIWGLPETILLRHFCLVLGALISIYEFYVYRKILTLRNLIPLLSILFLFVWISFHLLFLSENYDLQLVEYLGVWKRVLIGSIFAIGFGMSLSQVSNPRKTFFLKMLFFGSMTPVVIFYIKYFNTINYLGIHLDLNFLLLYTSAAKFFIPKTTYVCFSIPALAIALSVVKDHLICNKFSRTLAFFALFMTFAILTIFYLMDIKNGVLYGFLLFSIFVCIVVKKFVITYPVITILGVLLMLFLSSILIFGHIKNNPSWSSLAIDAKVAFKVNEIQKWKSSGSNGYPRNELGGVVAVTNYERIAWGITGTYILIKNPLGYGLVDSSYGYLASKEYPGAKLTQSHSGWLDLALGIGLPGLFMILLSLGMSIRRAINYHSFWRTFISWTALSILLMWCTTELSQKVFFDSLIFWVCLFAGLTLNAYPIRRLN